VIRRNRQGLAFGIKQAAIPTATLLSGLAAPVLALTVGWRVAFAAAAALAVGIAILAPREAWGSEPQHDGRPGSDRAGRGTLLVLALGLGLGSAAAVPLGSFLVESGVAAGLEPGVAGTLLAVASATSIAARFAAGWVADRRVRGHLRRIAILLFAGAVGFALLAVSQSPLLLVPGAILAFAAGWGWPGLFNFAVVNENRSEPAAATGFTQTGAYVGSALGPLAFGVIVDQLSYTAAWLGSAGLALGASVAMLVARRLVLRSRADADAIAARPAPVGR
jgi:cyanate permease